MYTHDHDCYKRTIKLVRSRVNGRAKDRSRVLFLIACIIIICPAQAAAGRTHRVDHLRVAYTLANLALGKITQMCCCDKRDAKKGCGAVSEIHRTDSAHPLRHA